jgi:AcrR family transcriptional regulator
MLKLKEHIVTTALGLFSKNGIKRVSMNDIAQSAGVSKRTLYEFFDNKEALLVEIVKDGYKQRIGYIRKLTDEGYTSMDIFLLFNEQMMENPTWFCNEFYEDLKRYQDANNFLGEIKTDFLNEIVFFLKKGAEEGVFLKEINFDIIALTNRERMNMSKPSEVFKKFTPNEVHNTIFLIFLRGISTDKGMKILEHYMLKKRYQEKNNMNQEYPDYGKFEKNGR